MREKGARGGFSHVFGSLSHMLADAVKPSGGLPRHGILTAVLAGRCGPEWASQVGLLKPRGHRSIAAAKGAFLKGKEEHVAFDK